MLTPSDGSMLYTIANGADKARVYQVNLAAANTLGEVAFTYTHHTDTGANSPKSIPYLSSTSLFVPYYNEDTFKFSIISHDISDMSEVLKKTIELSGNTA